MERVQPSRRSDFEQIARSMQNRNLRYLDHLKQSGDPSDFRSRVLATILDCVADGLVVVDDKLTVALANVAAAKLAGWELEDVTREELHRNYQLFSDDGQTPLPIDEEPTVVAMRDRRTCEMQVYAVSSHLGPGGRWIRAHAAPVLDDGGQSIGGVTVYSDITDRLRLQRERECLVALIAHDVKNHFAAEEVFFHLLLRFDADKFDEETLTILKDLQAASKKFQGITDSLIEMFRASFFADNDYGQEVDLSILVHEAIELSDLVAADRHVRVAVNCAAGCLMTRGLPSVISHVLHNIIQNAVEASPAGGVVTVCVSADSDFVSVSITDTGPGMSSEEVSQILSPHRVAGHTTKTTHSTGFGLYLSAMLVEGQGGMIKCKSEPGRGTTFTLMMPAIS